MVDFGSNLRLGVIGFGAIVVLIFVAMEYRGYGASASTASVKGRTITGSGGRVLAAVGLSTMLCFIAGMRIPAFVDPVLAGVSFWTMTGGVVAGWVLFAVGTIIAGST